MLRIGHCVSGVLVPKGYERNVSGHIQVPLRLMEHQAAQGHDVHLITNSFGEDRTWPWCMPASITSHLVPDGQRREPHLKASRGLHPLALVRQITAIKRVVHEHRLDLLHLHGSENSAALATGLRLAGLRRATVVTLFGSARSPKRFIQMLIRRCGPVVTATRFAADSWRRVGLDVTIVPHGAVRSFRAEEGFDATAPRDRVLFWRDLTKHNGADVAMAAFDELAPNYPDVRFDLAVRFNPNEVSGAEELARRHPNVQIHRFPYGEGVTLARLVAQSICIVLPFRRFTIQPQLAILESMEAGVPVVVSDVDSAREMVDDGRTGCIIPVGDSAATTGAIADLLDDRDRALAMGGAAAADVSRRWNWERTLDELARVYECALAGRKGW